METIENQENILSDPQQSKNVFNNSTAHNINFKTVSLVLVIAIFSGGIFGLIGYCYGVNQFINTHEMLNINAVTKTIKLSPQVEQAQPSITATPSQTSISQIPPILNPSNWIINTNQGPQNYSNSDAPFTLQYPIQWGYFEQVQGNVAGTEQNVPLYGVLFKQTPITDSSYNIYFVWGGGFGDPPHCDTNPMIQLKNEKLTACEYSLDTGEAMQIDKISPSLNLVIRTRTSKSVTQNQILNILSTVSFTKQ